MNMSKYEYEGLIISDSGKLEGADYSQGFWSWAIDKEELDELGFIVDKCKPWELQMIKMTDDPSEECDIFITAAGFDIYGAGQDSQELIDACEMYRKNIEAEVKSMYANFLKGHPRLQEKYGNQ